MDQSPTIAVRTIALLALVAGASPAIAGDDPPLPWLTGAAFEKQLDHQVSVSWSAAPLRASLERLARAQRIAILIDRRVDPGQLLESSFDERPLREILETVAHDRGLGLSVMPSLVYIGPSDAARRFRTVIALSMLPARQAPAASRRRLLLAAPLAWDDLAEPREILENLASDAGVELRGLDQVPHDLWAAASLPQLSLVDRLTLVAAQFDLTIEFGESGSPRLVPIPDVVAIEKRYPGGSKPDDLARRWSDECPDCEIEVESGKLVVRGLVEDHERLAGGPPAAAAQTVSSRPGNRRQVHTLKVGEAPVSRVLEELVKKLNLDLRTDDAAIEAAGLSLDTRVSFEVEKVSLDELLDAILSPAGLSFIREGDTIVIGPAAP